MSDNKKYLTEIKELPGYEESKSSPSSKKELDSRDNPSSSNNDKKTAKNDDSGEVSVQNVNLEDNSKDTKDILKPSNEKTRRIGGIPFSTRDILLNVINVLTFILLIVILTRMVGKAEELRSIRNENLKLSENYNYNQEQVDNSLDQAEQLRELFISESGVIDFVSDVENLSSSAIRKVSFSSPDPVQDRSGSYGRPIVITLRGSWREIDQAIDDIHELPYLFRPIKIEIEEPETGDEQDSVQGVFEVSYGGLLYTEDPGSSDE